MLLHATSSGDSGPSNQAPFIAHHGACQGLMGAYVALHPCQPLWLPTGMSPCCVMSLDLCTSTSLGSPPARPCLTQPKPAP